MTGPAGDLPQPEHAFDAEVLDDIRGQGWHAVVATDGVRPARGFGRPHVLRHPVLEAGLAYTAGVWRTWGHPEIVLAGAWPQARELLGAAVAAVRAGAAFAPGDTSDEVLARHAVTFGAVSERSRETLLTYAVWVHGGPAFGAVQLLVPDVEGRPPGDVRYAGPAQPGLDVHLRAPLFGRGGPVL
jgi:Domain of unknown function (DUF4262)